MRLAQFIKQAFRMTERGDSRPKTGTLIVPRKEDSVRDYPSAGLTPSKLAALLREADEGTPEAAMQLFEEMEEKDAHLYSVANTRRLALTGLDWCIVSAADLHSGADRAAADDAAAHAREILEGLDSFDETLQHLSLALGRNIAVAEIVWEFVHGGLRPVQLVPVDFTRLVFDDLDRPRLLTAEEPQAGLALPPNKFIVHTPHAVCGHAQRGGLLRVSALVYLAKHLALKDWMIFAEVFGMPVRIARYEPSASPEEKRELLAMLDSLGSNAAGIFSRAVELQVIEANRGTAGPPFPELIEFLNREMSKAWLGQTLTTDITGQSGSIAAAQTHESVRQDLLADDLRKEARTIRRDLLTPLTRTQFGSEVSVPHFRRKAKPPVKATELVTVLDAAASRLGLRIPTAWVHEALGIPQAGEREPVLRGLP